MPNGNVRITWNEAAEFLGLEVSNNPEYIEFYKKNSIKGCQSKAAIAP